MKKKYYIGLDQGTTGTTTLLLDETWNVVARGYKEHTQYDPETGLGRARSAGALAESDSWNLCPWHCLRAVFLQKMWRASVLTTRAKR